MFGLKATAEAASDKDALVVVYCASTQCPAGKKLAEKLVAEGYPHVLEYAGGIKEWAEEMGYPTQGK
ncbi:MAG: rhodanese-like domain-containing protein [Candidatus Paracaedibacter sp.]